MTGPSLLDQWRLVRAAVRDLTLSRGDLAVLVEVIDRFYQAKGNSRASSRFLQKELGISRRTAIRCLQRLCRHGYLSELRRGQGTRASEFVPNFAMADPALVVTPMTPLEENASGDTGDTTVVTPMTPLEVASGDTGDTHTFLPRPAYGMADGKEGTSCEDGTRGAATPPPSHALPGARSVPPRDHPQTGDRSTLRGFDELWAVFLNRTNRIKAKTAYCKLDPDPELHSRMVAAAEAWSTALQANKTERRWWPQLHCWLDKERWLEDPPAPYLDPSERKPKAKTRTKAETNRHDPDVVPAGTYRAMVYDCRKEDEDLVIEFAIDEGPYGGRRFTDVFRAGEEGSEKYRSNMESISSHMGRPFDELVGMDVILCVMPYGEISYEPAKPADRREAYRPDLAQRWQAYSEMYGDYGIAARSFKSAMTLGGVPIEMIDDFLSEHAMQ